MKSDESVTTYFTKTMIVANKMRFHGERMDDVVIVEKILHSLSTKYNYVVCSIKESKDVDTLCLDESSLLVHKQNMNRDTPADEQALKASMSIPSSNSRGRGRGKRKGRGRGKGRGDQNNSNGNDNHSQGREKEETSNFIEKQEAETLLMAVESSRKLEPNIWYVDTGCSNHMSRSKSSFSFLDEDFHSTVSFGDSSTVEVMVKRDIKIKIKNGFVETISNVLYVPDLKSNLLSASQLQEKGYVITIKQDTCEIYDPIRGAIAVIQMSSNRLFPLKIQTIQSCLAAEFWWIENSQLEDYGDRTSSNSSPFPNCDPTTFESVVKEDKWRKAMNDEIDAIERNKAWELCDLPKGHKTIGVK
eukprot:XP_015581307.1 uncharacterized protein LOC107262105 [Ricinus communis]